MSASHFSRLKWPFLQGLPHPLTGPVMHMLMPAADDKLTVAIEHFIAATGVHTVVVPMRCARGLI